MGTITVVDEDGRGPYTYQVDHMHFHAPAEHKLDFVRESMEMHIVHKLIGGPHWEQYHETLCVIGVLFSVIPGHRSDHPFLEKLHCENLEVIKEPLNFAELFPNDPHFYHYKGSLTTPPCTDVVNWFVLKETINVNQEHLEALREHWFCQTHGCHNYRECQPINDRKVNKTWE